MVYTIETRPSESFRLLHIIVRLAIHIHTVDAKRLDFSLHSRSGGAHYGERLGA